MPDVSIVGDMIVGFPGETEEDFEQSLSLLEAVRFKGVFVFKYSTRPGTVASKKFEDDLPDAIKKERNQRMLALQQSISKAHHEAMVGQEVEVLVEGAAKIDPATREAPRDAGGLVQIGRKTLARSGGGSREAVRLTSRTRGDHIVAFDGPPALVGGFARVRVERATGLSLTGRLVTTTDPGTGH